MVAAFQSAPAPTPRPTYRRRAKTLQRKQLLELRSVRARDVDDRLFADRPRTRGACAGAPRPCPWIGCKHHLYLDVNPTTGSIKLNFPNVAPDRLDKLPETCALDVADGGEITLEEVGELMQVSRERIRQVEARGLLALKLASPATRRRRPIGGAARIVPMAQLYDIHCGADAAADESADA